MQHLVGKGAGQHAGGLIHAGECCTARHGQKGEKTKKNGWLSPLLPYAVILEAR